MKVNIFAFRVCLKEMKIICEKAALIAAFII